MKPQPGFELCEPYDRERTHWWNSHTGKWNECCLCSNCLENGGVDGSQYQKPIKKSPEWISVKDKLPENGVTVLVDGGIARCFDGQWYTGMEEPMFVRRIQWPVTHWMPIPKPPTEASDAEKAWLEWESTLLETENYSTWDVFMAGYKAGKK